MKVEIIMYQQKYESFEDSVYRMILNSGKTFKEVGHHIWPTMTPDLAATRLRHSLNEDKREKLSLPEIIRICKFCDRYDVLDYFCDEIGFHRTEKIVADKDEERRSIKECIRTLSLKLSNL